MLNFMYNSLDTVKKLKHPTRKDFINLTIGIFVAVIIGGLLFIATDSLWASLYNRFYNIMK